ncbi:MAG: hypothetical protein ACT4O2_00135 [Beijerinckiaceae bacterium]
MSDAFEADVMDELYDAAEGPAQRYYGDAFEEEEFDALEEGFEDEFEEGFEEEFEAMEDYGDEGDLLDAMEEEVADALEEEDSDEFLRRLAGIARRVGRGVGRVARGAAQVARRAAPVVGRIARTVAPIASAIPIPQAQAIGRIAGLLGRVLPNQADEFDALDDVIDLAEEEDAVDFAAPIIAGLTVRRTMPGIARQPRAVRRQMVRSVSQATRTVTRRAGPQAARAVPRVVQAARRAAQRRGMPVRAVPQAVRRVAARVARSPQTVRRLAGAPGAGMARRGMGRMMRRGGRSYSLRGPVRITIQGR